MIIRYYQWVIVILDGIIIQSNKKKVRILISNESCRITLFLLLKYFTNNVNNKVNSCFLLTHGNKKEEIGTQISSFEIKNMSFKEYCIWLMAGDEIVNKVVSDSIYIELNTIKGWEFILEKNFSFHESDIMVIGEKKKIFITKYINEKL